MDNRVRFLMAALGASFSLVANASPAGATDTPSGAALANVCAGRGAQMGGAGNAGQAYVPEPNFACNFALAPAGAAPATPPPAHGQGSFNGLNYSNDAHALATPGAMHLVASNNGNNGIPFPGAGVDTGYDDRVTVTSLNGNSGDALWVLPFHLLGNMTSMTGGYTELTTAAYKNFQILGGGLPVTTFKALNVSNYGNVGSSNQLEEINAVVNGAAPLVNIDAVVQFVIPVTLGTAFDYSIWAKLDATEQASGPAGPQNQSDADISFNYLGGGYLILPNNGIEANLNVTSVAGIDYSHAVAAVPLPGSLGSALLGLVGLVGMRRRRAS
jgi:hypothetical protein